MCQNWEGFGIFIASNCIGLQFLNVFRVTILDHGFEKIFYKEKIKSQKVKEILLYLCIKISSALCFDVKNWNLSLYFLGFKVLWKNTNRSCGICSVKTNIDWIVGVQNVSNTFENLTFQTLDLTNSIGWGKALSAFSKRWKLNVILFYFVRILLCGSKYCCSTINSYSGILSILFNGGTKCLMIQTCNASTKFSFFCIGWSN